MAVRLSALRAGRFIQWVPGIFSAGIKRQGREAAHSPPYTAEVKNEGAIPPPLHTSLWRSV
jgi:hypothetical protein